MQGNRPKYEHKVILVKHKGNSPETTAAINEELQKYSDFQIIHCWDNGNGWTRIYLTREV